MKTLEVFNFSAFSLDPLGLRGSNFTLPWLLELALGKVSDIGSKTQPIEGMRNYRLCLSFLVSDVFNPSFIQFSILMDYIREPFTTQNLENIKVLTGVYTAR